MTTKKPKPRTKKAAGTSREKIKTKKTTKNNEKKPRITEIDYMAIEIPPTKVDRKTFDATLRRAELSHKALQLGSVERIPTNECRTYGISGAVICKDKKVIREYLKRKWLKPELIISEALLLMQAAGEVAVEQKESGHMRQAAVEMVRMGQELGVLDKVAEPIKHEVEVRDRTVGDILDEDKK